jgi:hypothetical protein
MKRVDIYVLASMLVRKKNSETLEHWGARTGLSVSVLHRCLKQLLKSKLVVESDNGYEPIFRNVKEFLMAGFPYVFPEEKGKLQRGFVTGIDGSSLKGDFVDSEFPFVWANYEGDTKGFSIEPLHKAIPDLIASNRLDGNLYEILALLDVLRTGMSREVEAAKGRIKELLESYEQQNFTD